MSRLASVLTDLQRRVYSLDCPSCSKRKLELVLQCAVHWDGCVFVARCGFCGTQYLVDVDMKTAPVPEVIDPPAEGATKVVCPRCGSLDCAVGFRCSADSHICSYEIECAACRTADVRAVSVATRRRIES